MVEFLMVFALGALSATALALLALPALSRRADRLARRRTEALFPVSIEEIVAERDHVRAEMAVEKRKSELWAERIAKEKAADMAEIGRRDVALHETNEKLADRAREIERLEAELAQTRSALADAKASLDGTSATLTEKSAELDLLRGSHASLKSAHEMGSGELTQTRLHLRLTAEDLEQIRHQLDERNKSYLALEQEHRALRDTAAERQLVIAAHETKIENLTHDLLDARRRLTAATEQAAEREGEAKALRSSIDQMRKDADALEESTDKNHALADENARLSDRIEALAEAIMQDRPSKAASAAATAPKARTPRVAGGKRG